MSGVYDGPVIQEPPIKCTTVHVPQIEDIRAVVHDGETYLNAKDLTIAMRKMSLTQFTSVSVINFVKTFVIELIRR